MKLKFNWGTGIVIALFVMVCGMSTLVYIATRQDYFLVEKDYYQKGINYQDQIDRVSNTNALRSKPEIILRSQQLSIQFPNWFAGKNISGEILIYSPVNENMDQTYTLKLDDSLAQVISLEGLGSGRYTVKLNWTANEVPYYFEQVILKE